MIHEDYYYSKIIQMLIKEYIINLEENWNKVLSSLLIDNAELLRYGEWIEFIKKMIKFIKLNY